ncbi:unnamed protein product [Microthlaspi erraticum]|uniref:Retrotransposon gag domain-containing protein n=1 Tax=Microthlaspi erraticum TaxID=1685480 RepID=A0A6D2KSF9_9BRAS|nr:unnamed protein product [Microthlaspi erraticum]
MDSVLSNSQGARSRSQIPSDQITSDVSSAKTADTSKNPITSPTGSSQTASRSSVLIDPVITSAAANSNVLARVKPSVINLVTPVIAENSILPNQISHAIEKPHLRIRVKSKDFPITSTPISRKTPTQTVSMSLAELKTIISPPPGTQLDSSPIYEPNSSLKRDEAPPRAPVIQTLIPPMTSLKSSSKRDEAPLRALVIQTLIPPMTLLNSSSKRDEAPDQLKIEVSEADLWTLSQAPNESHRSYVNRFKAIIAKIENPNEAVALLAFRNNLWYKSKFREELIVRPPVSLDDALRCALTFATFEEEITLLLEKYRKGKLPQHSISVASSVLKSNSSSEVDKFYKIHKKHDHSTEECRSYVKKQKRKARLAIRNKTSSNDNDKASQKRERKVGINHQESPLSKKKRSDSTQHLESSAHAADQ